VAHEIRVKGLDSICLVEGLREWGREENRVSGDLDDDPIELAEVSDKEGGEEEEEEEEDNVCYEEICWYCEPRSTRSDENLKANRLKCTAKVETRKSQMRLNTMKRCLLGKKDCSSHVQLDFGLAKL